MIAKMFKKKEFTDYPKNIPAVDVFHLIRKDNYILKTIVLIHSLISILLLFLFFILKEPKIKILRLYDKPSLNETISLENSNEKIRKQDILLLVKFIIEHLDFKSPNTLSNYEKPLSIAEGEMLSNLKEIEQHIVLYSPEFQSVHNSLENSDIKFD